MSRSSLKLPEPPAELAALSHSLCNSIVNAIAAEGPIPFSHYMQMALYEPGLGYYVNGLHKFGQSGDFITAPETGTLFAAALARTLAPPAEALGADWTLLELGPGSGALAADLLPELARPPARYLLLEPSAALREVQRERLAALPANLRKRVEWIDRPPEKGFDGAILANEVIDALPVERFRRTADGFDQLCVTTNEGGRFAWASRPAKGRLLEALQTLETRLGDSLAEGYESEICVDLPEWMRTVLAPLQRGLALFVDYGYPRAEFYHPDRSEGTLVCHYRHRAHFDPFIWPGLTDISAFVDFSAAAEAAQACDFDLAAFTSQAGLVIGSGVHQRLEQEMDERTRLALTTQFKRLVLPGEMGEKFKLLALARDIEPPSNFQAMPDYRPRL
ncbi:MAG: class I SAM-dependent methyltransferase [Wenzhouxiangellaceae bacterium]